MDVKSAFLNGFIYEQIFIKQPHEFENPKFSYHILKFSKALYHLKQVPQAWYNGLKNFLANYEFTRGKIDTTLFIKRTFSGNLIIQIYVDNIIFWSTNTQLCKDFSKLMQGELKMIMMGELTFFLELKIKQSTKGTFICQSMQKSL